MAYATDMAAAKAALPVGDVVDRWRGRLPELRDRSMFLNVTGSDATGWKFRTATPALYSGQGELSTQARGQTHFHNQYGVGQGRPADSR